MALAALPLTPAPLHASTRGEGRTIPREESTGPESLPWEQLRSRVLTVFFTGYFFVLGGVVGSFLNVVVYRMPLGQGLMWPGSRCPACLTPIKLFDNIPIISWLWLRGRCRACTAAISARYFWVETAMATLFLALAWIELLSGGANLPVRPVNPHSGVMQVLWETKWDLLGLYLYHACLLSVLIAMALIRADGHRVPRRLTLFALTAGLLPPLAWPWLRPVPGTAEPVAWLSTADWARALADGLLGISLGALFGLLLGWSERGPRTFGITAMLTIAGAFLGWQAAVYIALATAVLLLVRRVPAQVEIAGPQSTDDHQLASGGRQPTDDQAPSSSPDISGVTAAARQPSVRNRLPDEAFLAAAAFLLLALWRPLFENVWHPGATGSLLEPVAAFLVLLTLTFIIHLKHPRPL